MSTARKLNLSGAPQGHFAMHRIDLRPLLGDCNALGLWMILNSMKAFRERQQFFGGVTWPLAIGQLITAERVLVAMLGVSRDIVRSKMAKLERLGFVDARRSPAGTLITVKGSGLPSQRAHHDSPPENLHHSTHHLPTSGALDPQRFAGEVLRDPPAEPTREKKGEQKTTPINPHPSHARASAEGGDGFEASEVFGPPKPTPPEHVEVLEHATASLKLRTSKLERDRFLETLAEMTPTEVDALRRDVDWLARRDIEEVGVTFSINRVFQVGWLQRKVVAWRLGDGAIFRPRRTF